MQRSHGDEKKSCRHSLHFAGEYLDPAKRDAATCIAASDGDYLVDPVSRIGTPHHKNRVLLRSAASMSEFATTVQRNHDDEKKSCRRSLHFAGSPVRPVNDVQMSTRRRIPRRLEKKEELSPISCKNCFVTSLGKVSCSSCMQQAIALKSNSASASRSQTRERFLPNPATSSPLQQHH